jgi:hypothetical protein
MIVTRDDYFGCLAVLVQTIPDFGKRYLSTNEIYILFQNYFRLMGIFLQGQGHMMKGAICSNNMEQYHLLYDHVIVRLYGVYLNASIV